MNHISPNEPSPQITSPTPLEDIVLSSSLHTNTCPMTSLCPPTSHSMQHPWELVLRYTRCRIHLMKDFMQRMKEHHTGMIGYQYHPSRDIVTRNRHTFHDLLNLYALLCLYKHEIRCQNITDIPEPEQTTHDNIWEMIEKGVRYYWDMIIPLPAHKCRASCDCQELEGETYKGKVEPPHQQPPTHMRECAPPLFLCSSHLARSSHIGHSGMYILVLCAWHNLLLTFEIDKDKMNKIQRLDAIQGLAEGIMKLQRLDGSYKVYFDTNQLSDEGMETYTGVAMYALMCAQQLWKEELKRSEPFQNQQQERQKTNPSTTSTETASKNQNATETSKELSHNNETPKSDQAIGPSTRKCTQSLCTLVHHRLVNTNSFDSISTMPIRSDVSTPIPPSPLQSGPSTVNHPLRFTPHRLQVEQRRNHEQRDHYLHPPEYAHDHYDTPCDPFLIGHHYMSSTYNVSSDPAAFENSLEHTWTSLASQFPLENLLCECNINSMAWQDSVERALPVYITYVQNGFVEKDYRVALACWHSLVCSILVRQTFTTITPNTLMTYVWNINDEIIQSGWYDGIIDFAESMNSIEVAYGVCGVIEAYMLLPDDSTHADEDARHRRSRYLQCIATSCAFLAMAQSTPARLIDTHLPTGSVGGIVQGLTSSRMCIDSTSVTIQAFTRLEAAVIQRPHDFDESFVKQFEAIIAHLS